MFSPASLPLMVGMATLPGTHTKLKKKKKKKGESVAKLCLTLCNPRH